MPKITNNKVKPISCTKNIIQKNPMKKVVAVAVDKNFIYVPCMCEGAIHVYGSGGFLKNRKELRNSHCSELSYQIIINEKTYKSEKDLSKKKLRQLLTECSNSSY